MSAENTPSEIVTPAEAQAEAIKAADGKNSVTLPAKSIKLNASFNARLKYDGLEELSNDIKKQGLLQPLVVRPGEKEGTYEVVAGHRRYLAITKHLKWDEIPCIIREYKEEPDAIFANLSENVSRRSLTGYELALKCHELATTYKVSGATIANRLQELSRSYINNLLRIIANVAPEIIKAWKEENAVATVDFLVTLAKYKDHAEQLELWKKAVKARKVDGDSTPDSRADKDEDEDEDDKDKAAPGVRLKRPGAEVIATLIEEIRELDKVGQLRKMLKADQMGDFAIACLKFSLGRPKKVKVGDFLFDPSAPDAEEEEADE